MKRKDRRRCPACGRRGLVDLFGDGKTIACKHCRYIKSDYRYHITREDR